MKIQITIIRRSRHVTFVLLRKSSTEHQLDHRLFLATAQWNTYQVS